MVGERHSGRVRFDRAAAVCLSALLAAPLLLVGIQGCSTGGGGPSGPDDGPDAPAETLYVDPAFAGEEHGTEANPFNTIGEALDVARHGYRIVLAAGDYDDQVDIEVHHAVEITGAGAGLTVFDVGFALAADTTAPAVIIEALTCETVRTLVDTSLHSRCAYEVRDCDLASLVDTLGSVDSLHYRTVAGCVVAGDLLLGGRSLAGDCRVRDSHVLGSLEVGGLWVRSACIVKGCAVGGDATVSGVAARDTLSLESCSVGGDAGIRSVSMSSEQRMVDCVVTGKAGLFGVSTTSTRADGNTVHGDSLVVTAAAVSSCVVTDNHLTSGSLKVAARSIIGEISDNTLDDGGICLWGISSRVPIEGNTVTRSTIGTGISVYSVSLGGLVRDNTVVVPYAAPTGTPVPSDSLAPAGISAVGVAIKGVRNNTVSGGSYGIYMSAVAGHGCSMNTVGGAHTGIAVCGVSVHADSNDVSGCSGDGIGLYAYDDDSWGGEWLTVQANTVVGNAGAGIHASARCDLGGSPDTTAAMFVRTAAGGAQTSRRLTSAGLNTLTGNGGYDLMVDMAASQVDTIWALWNTWDHADSAGIADFDVYDGDDDPSLTRAVFWPARER